MIVTRLDLDGAGSPTAIVSKILKAEPALPIPVPIEQLAHQLDINEIREWQTEGFIGGLLTDYVRSFGVVLVKSGLIKGRRRFTIAHELGHFLIPTHKPVRPGEFRCSSDDMKRWTSKEKNALFEMEAQANEFASLILMPPPALRKFIAQTGKANLKHVISMHDAFEVSKEAAARAYATYHPQSIAILIVQDCKILRTYYNRSSFPPLALKRGDELPAECSARLNTRGLPSSLQRTDPTDWLRIDQRQRAPNLFEQSLIQINNFAMVLLLAEHDADEDDFDPDADRTSKQRLQARLNRD